MWIFNTLKILKMIRKIAKDDMQSRSGTCLFCEEDYTKEHLVDCEWLKLQKLLGTRGDK